jgi:CheY-like chemotaxis protein
VTTPALTAQDHVVVSRQQVFTLVDGTFVVQWERQRVQEILSGVYRSFDYAADFGHPVTPYELAQLQTAGLITDFDEWYVLLRTLPQATRSGSSTPRLRLYYLNTTLSAAVLDYIQELLVKLGAGQLLMARERDGFVVILGKDGRAFRNLDEMEQAQKWLQQKAPRILNQLTPGFVETTLDMLSGQELQASHRKGRELYAFVTSQGEVSVTEGKQVVLAVRQEEERQAIATLLGEMGMLVHHAGTGREAILLLEDNSCDFLVLDIQLADMHAWAMLRTLKESVDLSRLPTIVITDEQVVTALENVTPVVRPFSMARLRFTIRDLFLHQ